LINCFTNGEYKIDNNYIESHIRPFTIGCKNLMFSVKPESAVENAKGNGLDPFDYLNIVFTKLQFAKTERDFLDLLPVKI
jgi:transposase